ncbi:MAG: ribosome small subunit-dependent GTPase A [Hyphomicrobiales bacterium]
MRNPISDLKKWGWKSFFARQIQETESNFAPVRVVEVHRSGIRVVGPEIDLQIPRFSSGEGDDEIVATAGDWLLLDGASARPVRMLQRKSLFQRRAPGKARKLQLIAANIDTLFIVTSCNHEFNKARLERYLALAKEAEVLPIVILTKSDLCEGGAHTYLLEAQTLSPDLLVEIVDARNPESVSHLAGWCGTGETVALVGSSGVGKSTLVNTLSGTKKAETQSVRESDSKGKHTTSHRTFHQLPTGGWLLDTPGIRELQLTDVKEGIDEVFSDIVELITQCRFSNCQHKNEPGCAVQAALNAGELQLDRFKSWQKLAAEELRNTRSIAGKHTKNRALAKMIKRATKHKNTRNFE